jgi:hypothetical protein
VGLELGPFNLVNTFEGYAEENVAAPVWKTEIAAVGVRRTDRAIKLALTSPTSSGRSVGIVRFRTGATELLLFITLDQVILHLLHKPQFCQILVHSRNIKKDGNSGADSVVPSHFVGVLTVR